MLTELQSTAFEAFGNIEPAKIHTKKHNKKTALLLVLDPSCKGNLRIRTANSKPKCHEPKSLNPP